MTRDRSGWRWAVAGALALGGTAARGEGLDDAWRMAMGRNLQVQASRQAAEAAGFDLEAAKADRRPKLQTINAPTFLTNSISATGLSGQPQAAAGGSQREFTLSVVAATMPIYAGGRIRNTIASNEATVNAARADEFTTGADLRLEVARAYLGVLRARRTLEVARGNVASLTAQARDAGNLLASGRGIRNDLLAAQVAQSNARQRVLQLGNQLSVAWATYNRTLGRPLEVVVPLVELAVEPRPGAAPPEVTPAEEDPAMRIQGAPMVDEARLRPLVERALKNRTELAGLTEQARARLAQAEVERAATRPQAAFVVANLYQNARFLPSQADSGAASFLVNWTAYDGGKARRRAQAEERRAAALCSQRADLASQVALQVRTAWLNVEEARRRIPVAQAATAQAEENLRVARDRFVRQRGTSTEVLDAEDARLLSLNSYYGAIYDHFQAEIDLRRAMGCL